ncbi:MAG: AAA family ATPase [Desulfobacteraceae bacterium]|nr:AAA family ATPase [Desulfobacteraceae bacterium]
MIPKHLKRIPYGVADFEKIRNNNLYYVDKTNYIPFMESASYYVFLIRPRRFGKSLWVSLLENYYDISKKDRFEELFRDTFIVENPTDEKNSYLILTFNFSMVNPDIRFTEASFEANGKTVIRDFMERYTQFFSEQEKKDILLMSDTADRLREILYHASRKNLKIYLLIDEYDNFANTILSTVGEKAYQELTHGPGFFRYFFNLLKGGTSRGDSGLSRLFITGVSPVTMDDVTSGFNIGRNISLEGVFNELTGFNEGEVRAMLDYYQHEGLFEQDIELCTDIMKEWYDHYCFSADTDNRVFNPDMVLYFNNQVIDEGKIPRHLIDQNIRIDYGKLRHLILADKRLNGNFSILKEIMDTGETACDVELSFPLEQLLDRKNFVSLLFFFGLLSFNGVRKGKPLLHIPNLTVRKLMYGYLRDAFRDVDVFRIDIWKFADLVADMAYHGRWQPVFDFLGEEVQKQTSVRDYLGGEKIIQGFLLAYLNVTDFFLTWSEKEMGSGFADLFLEPFLARFPDMTFGYLIELKYISRGEFKDSLLQKKIRSAKEKLQQYAGDTRVAKIAEKVTLKKLVIVYKGWELVYREEVI